MAREIKPSPDKSGTKTSPDATDNKPKHRDSSRNAIYTARAVSHRIVSRFQELISSDLTSEERKSISSHLMSLTKDDRNKVNRSSDIDFIQFIISLNFLKGQTLDEALELHEIKVRLDDEKLKRFIERSRQGATQTPQVNEFELVMLKRIENLLGKKISSVEASSLHAHFISFSEEKKNLILTFNNIILIKYLSELNFIENEEVLRRVSEIFNNLDLKEKYEEADEILPKKGRRGLNRTTVPRTIRVSSHLKKMIDASVPFGSDRSSWLIAAIEEYESRKHSSPPPAFPDYKTDTTIQLSADPKFQKRVEESAKRDGLKVGDWLKRIAFLSAQNSKEASPSADP